MPARGDYGSRGGSAFNTGTVTLGSQPYTYTAPSSGDAVLDYPTTAPVVTGDPVIDAILNSTGGSTTYSPYSGLGGAYAAMDAAGTWGGVPTVDMSQIDLSLPETNSVQDPPPPPPESTAVNTGFDVDSTYPDFQTGTWGSAGHEPWAIPESDPNIVIPSPIPGTTGVGGGVTVTGSPGDWTNIPVGILGGYGVEIPTSLPGDLPTWDPDVGIYTWPDIPTSEDGQGGEGVFTDTVGASEPTVTIPPILPSYPDTSNDNPAPPVVQVDKGTVFDAPAPQTTTPPVPPLVPDAPSSGPGVLDPAPPQDETPPPIGTGGSVLDPAPDEADTPPVPSTAPGAGTGGGELDPGATNDDITLPPGTLEFLASLGISGAAVNEYLNNQNPEPYQYDNLNGGWSKTENRMPFGANTHYNNMAGMSATGQNYDYTGTGDGPFANGPIPGSHHAQYQGSLPQLPYPLWPPFK